MWEDYFTGYELEIEFYNNPSVKFSSKTIEGLMRVRAIIMYQYCVLRDCRYKNETLHTWKGGMRIHTSKLDDT